MNEMVLIDDDLLDRTSEEALRAPRLRMNHNFHTREDEPVNRLLNGHGTGNLSAGASTYGSAQERVDRRAQTGASPRSFSTTGDESRNGRSSIRRSACMGSTSLRAYGTGRSCSSRERSFSRSSRARMCRSERSIWRRGRRRRTMPRRSGASSRGFASRCRRRNEPCKSYWL